MLSKCSMLAEESLDKAARMVSPVVEVVGVSEDNAKKGL